jgi:hypothetical protein
MACACLLKFQESPHMAGTGVLFCHTVKSSFEDYMSLSLLQTSLTPAREPSLGVRKMYKMLPTYSRFLGSISHLGKMGFKNLCR